MTQEQIIKKVSNLQTRQDLLILLNEVVKDELGEHAFEFTMKQLNYYCNPYRSSTKRYHQFTIPKKSGGVRVISSPSRGLKCILSYLNVIFQALYEPSEAAMGFVPGRSIKDNAAVHVNSNYVFNTDLKDFFPSFAQARVWKVLQLKPFCFNEDIASFVAGLCCIAGPEGHGILPQGSPCSPILTNIVCRRMDRRLNGLARRFNLHYTRYADDITFSSLHNVYQEDGEFLKEFRRIISVENFVINEKKTRLQKKGERQEVTGLVVNENVNVTREYVRNLKSILYIWKTYGYNQASIRFYRHYFTSPHHIKGALPKMENVIEGQLMYLRQIKGEDSPVFINLWNQFHTLYPQRLVCDKENFHYIFSSRISDFEDNFGVKLNYVHKKLDERDTSKTMANFTLKDIVSKVWITPRCDKVISQYLIEPTENLEQKISRFYITLAERGKKKIWLIMKDEPHNYHKASYADFKTKTTSEPQSETIDCSGLEISSDIYQLNLPKEDSLSSTLHTFVTDFNFKTLEEWHKTKNS